MQLGVIADDITGATDVAAVLRRAGLTVIQTVGQPHRLIPEADVVVISLKIRTAPATEAVTQAEQAANRLLSLGASQLYFKYCSTFDSTDSGNIGPIADRLLDLVNGEQAFATPAYPSLGRTVYQGHLFVGDRLLSESSMRDHPLTPMRDADLVRVLGRQSASPVGLIRLSSVDAGIDAIEDACRRCAAQGQRLLVADAVSDRHLHTLGAVGLRARLVTGAAGLAHGLAQHLTSHHPVPTETQGDRRAGATVILSGSCSTATQAQVEQARALIPSRELDPLKLGEDGYLSALMDWTVGQVRRNQEPLMIFSTADPATVRAAQQTLGSAQAANAVESAFRVLAAAMADAGARTFIVAGGETSGAVLDALHIRTIGFEEEISPGVPWTSSLDPKGFHLALKSGNFGAPDFFLRALGRTI